MKRPITAKSVAPEADDTGLPWLRSWTKVYLVVIINFVLWVTLLVALTVFFS
ncbi:MAG: hypothetical protein JO251_05070 [Verrucomicrobia bacterium]|nr:hypothetical protein [Verrucomicrobiota bacterium]MBV8641487.1 hypothetical protein [Verrucomicrobiota bacterium]